ncbi:MAG: hypothetical protein K6T83_16235 [Alicyclobacillus sp.]|nr:hypothetical protein [Alicyclobacillus sp.]
MFIDINQLRGLIVKLGDRSFASQPRWREITELVATAFIYEDEEVLRCLDAVSSSRFLRLDAKFGLVRTIETAVTELGLPVYEIAYVSNDQYDFRETILPMTRIGSVLINGSRHIDFDVIGGYLPDFILNSLDELVGVIQGNNFRGHYSEVVATRIEDLNWQSYRGFLTTFALERDRKTYMVLTGGRYFGNDHVRRPTHQLSHRISESKDKTRHDDVFSIIVTILVDYIHNTTTRVDGVTRVPPRPDNVRDRLAPWVDKACSELGLMNTTSNLLCVQSYPSQRVYRTSRSQRMENVAGKFRVVGNLEGKHIVLVDDVLVTGATTLECASQLMAAGASRVTIAVIAVNQFDVPWLEPPKRLSCPSHTCDGHMVLRFRHDNNEAFFGCTNYTKRTCRRTISFVEGWRMYNELNAEDFERNRDLDDLEDMLF